MADTRLQQYQHPGLGDRTLVVPKHTGDTVLPNLPIFDKLLRFAHRTPPRIAIRDLNVGVEKTYLQLLTDVLALRRVLRASLSPSIRKDLLNDQEVFIALIAPGGYEYVVAFLAIQALGAAVVPITTALPIEEAKSLVLRSRSVSLVSSSDATATALAQGVIESIQQHQDQDHRHPIPHLTVSPHLQQTPLPAATISISSDCVPNFSAAALVIFTSGTTGPPKGAVQRRSYISGAGEEVADHYRISEQDTVLHLLPVHHATGIGVTLLPFLVRGACVEFRSGSFDPAWTWDRWRESGASTRTRNSNSNTNTNTSNNNNDNGRRLTFFSGVPTIYTRMMHYFESTIAKLPPAQVDAYIRGARSLRVLLCGTSALPGPVQQFWTNVLDGNPILTRYGGTEFGAVLKADLGAGVTPLNSVGRVAPGVSLKLNEEGMILVKGPHIFSKYLYDEKATAQAHDTEGYFITGDIARQEGPNYFILGRASLDIIKSGGYKLSALDIEREILGLNYVAEVMVVGVEDDEYGQRVAAAITLKGDRKELSLDQLRADLRGKLAGYKMPTVLRVLEGEIPKSGTGKVQKKILGPKYFPGDYRGDPKVEVWERREQVKAKL